MANYEEIMAKQPNRDEITTNLSNKRNYLKIPDAELIELKKTNCYTEVDLPQEKGHIL